MVTVKLTGLKELAENLKKKFLTIEDKNTVVRTVATTLCGEIKQRIHEQGLNSSGSQIGTYSLDYMRIRQKKNRGSSRKVIISLSGQLENDFSIGITNPIKTQLGWGLGFKNNFNAEKAEWMEEQYGAIWNLTNSETKKVKEVAEFEVSKILKGK